MNLAPSLLEILVCPACHSSLRVDDAANELACTNHACALIYPVRDDIPVLLIDEARPGKADGSGTDSGTGSGTGSGSASGGKPTS